MKVKVYRGAAAIGGTCIELKANNAKTLWLDLGLPLSDKKPDISYAKNNSPDALLISHSHQDHYGLMEHLDSNIPVHIGIVTKGLIQTPRIFINTPAPVNNFIDMKPWEMFTVADTFKVTPYLVDHSSPEAFAFLIEADGKRVFYTGDFRSTGRKRVLYEKFIKRPPKDIDALFIEGTMIERDNQKYKTEEEIESAIFEIIKDQENISFVISSAQNIDRFVSVARACKKTGKKVVIDIYNTMVLDVVSAKSKGTPTIERDEVLVYLKGSQFEKINTPEYESFIKRIEKQGLKDEAFNKPSDYVYFLRCPNLNFIDRLRGKGKMNLIYSQWEGYLENEYWQYFTDIINGFKNDKDFNFHTIHTSGHATIKVLKELAKALNPKQIIPIHTENPEKFKKEFEKDGFKNVKEIEDGVYFNI